MPAESWVLLGQHKLQRSIWALEVIVTVEHLLSYQHLFCPDSFSQIIEKLGHFCKAIVPFRASFSIILLVCPDFQDSVKLLTCNSSNSLPNEPKISNSVKELLHHHPFRLANRFLFKKSYGWFLSFFEVWILYRQYLARSTEDFSDSPPHCLTWPMYRWMSNHLSRTFFQVREIFVGLSDSLVPLHQFGMIRLDSWYHNQRPSIRNYLPKSSLV